jgi:hypothetical protein
VDPYPDSESGSRRANINNPKIKKEEISSAACSLLGAESFFRSLDVFHGGLGIGKRQFLIKKYLIFFSSNFFYNFGH